MSIWHAHTLWMEIDVQCLFRVISKRPGTPAANHRRSNTMRAMNISTANTHPTTRRPARAISIALWVLQVLLAAAFLAHGWLMVAPPADMVAMINAQLGEGLRIFIG